MHCSSCGTAVNPGVSYCNRCGAGVDAKKGSANNKLSELPPGFLVCGIVVVMIVGLAAITTLLSQLKQAGQFAGVIMAFTMLSFLVVLAIEILFFWMLLRSKTKAAAATGPSQIKGSVPRELAQGQAQMLPEPKISVTDHTTRTLEPIHSSRTVE